MPAEEFYDTPDPMPKYLEGCSKAEFKHIFNYFDLGKIYICFVVQIWWN